MDLIGGRFIIVNRRGEIVFVLFSTYGDWKAARDTADALGFTQHIVVSAFGYGRF